MIVLGVDPGLSGGLALVRRNDVGAYTLMAVIAVPTTGDKAKRRVDVARVLDFIRAPGRTPDHAFIERAQAMPKQGSSSGFVYGRAVGTLEACVQGSLIPMTIVESSAWKKAHGLIKPSGSDSKDWAKIVKENSRQRAIMLFPDARGFELKGDHNRAEAALIAWYGMSTLIREIAA
jgi:crossover junction endodeoxyribonuclease RuvC